MNLNDILQWFLGHNVVLIEALFVVILVSVAYILFISVIGSKDGGDLNIAEIEKSLRKIIDSSQVRPSVEVERAASLIQDDDESQPTQASVDPAAAAAAKDAAALAAAQVEQFKKEVALKENKLQELQKALEEAKKTPAAAPVDTSGLENQIKELQAKLSEYEIIEDDIANLSNYKNENAKLKEEIDKMKTRPAGKVAPASTGPSEHLKEFAALVDGDAPKGKTEDTPPATPPPPVVAAPPPPPQAAAPLPPVPPPPAATPTPPASEAPAEAVLGETDPDKIIAESANLPDLPATEEAPANEEEVGKKLIDEFESFMKDGQ